MNETIDIAEILKSTPLIDGHNDLPAALRGKAGYSVDGLASGRTELHTDIARMREGQMGGQFWSVWVPSSIPEADAVVATLEQVDAVARLIAAYPDDLQAAARADDVESAFAAGKIASLIGIEGGHSIAESLGVLRMFATLGVRYMTLTHNDDTTWAASGTGVRQTTGLNDMGRAIVAEMNRIGMIVDLSHTSESTQMDALDVTTAPVMFSHSSAKGVADHPRNVSDKVLARLAGNGGVCQITFVPGFISAAVNDWRNESLARRRELGVEQDPAAGSTTRLSGVSSYSDFATAPRPGESAEEAQARNDARVFDTPEVDPAAQAEYDGWVAANPQPKATMADVVAHLNHAREVAGPDHIGVGGDYDGVDALPAGLEDVSKYPVLFAELASQGWSGSDLRKLAGENILRVIRATEEAATDLLAPTTTR